MSSLLHCCSFHSVKGGVGKSTLSTLTAIALAHKHPDANVYLIDMDLTGTSLADVLPIEAPRWDEEKADGRLDLLQNPSGFHHRAESKKRMRSRSEVLAPVTGAIGVPFLNDHLLFEPENWDEEQDVSPRAISWRFAKGPANLHVLPSSALPRDLNRALPVIYDEEHAAFLEARLETLLAAMVAEGKTTYVVFDTPPTIPGLSRSVLNMAFRLSGMPKKSLSKDGFVPAALEDVPLTWRAYLVATLDCQDIRAAERWLHHVPPEVEDVVQLVLNRVRVSAEQRESELRRILQDDESTIERNEFGDLEPMQTVSEYVFGEPVWIDEDVVKQEVFRKEDTPPQLLALLRDLRIELESDTELV